MGVARLNDGRSRDATPSGFLLPSAHIQRLNHNRINYSAVALLLAVIVGILGQVDAKADNLKFNCGDSAFRVISVSGGDALGLRERSTKRAKGEDCDDLVEEKEAICRQVLGDAPNDGDKKAAQEWAKQKCEQEVATALRSSVVTCNSESVRECIDPTDCAPLEYPGTGCVAPELTGDTKRFARVTPWEVGGYPDDVECELSCGWEFGYRAQKVRVAQGCSDCTRTQASPTPTAVAAVE